MKSLVEVMAIINFLGSDMTEKQAADLMDDIRQMSEGDKLYLLQHAHGPIYTELSMHDVEMGGMGW